MACESDRLSRVSSYYETLGLEPTADRSGVELVRPDLSGVADMTLERLEFARQPLSVRVQGGRGRVTPHPSLNASS